MKETDRDNWSVSFSLEPQKTRGASVVLSNHTVDVLIRDWRSGAPAALLSSLRTGGLL